MLQQQLRFKILLLINVLILDLKNILEIDNVHQVRGTKLIFWIQEKLRQLKSINLNYIVNIWVSSTVIHLLRETLPFLWWVYLDINFTSTKSTLTRLHTTMTNLTSTRLSQLPLWQTYNIKRLSLLYKVYHSLPCERHFSPPGKLR